MATQWRCTAIVGALVLAGCSANECRELPLDDTPEAVRITCHPWRSIAFPSLPVPWGGSGASVRVSNKDDELRLSLILFGPGIESDADIIDLPDPAALSATLHLGSEAAEATVQPVKYHGWISRLWAAQYSYSCGFPWKSSTLEEAWIELRLEDTVYWLELPYGFACDPRSPPTGPKALSGPPRLPADRVHQIADKLVPWTWVEYDLGAVENDLRVTLQQANPFDASCEVILYRQSFLEGSESWSLHEPRTSMRIRQHEAYTVESTCRAIRRHDDGLRRSDVFSFWRNLISESRSWGVLVVTVGDVEHAVAVPSSVYRYTHGLTTEAHRVYHDQTRGSPLSLNRSFVQR